MSEHTTSEEIESEIEETRTGLGRTLDGLQRRLSPDSLIGDTLRSARIGEALKSVGSDGAELARKIGRAASDHPLPLILTGAGLTWLAIAGLRGREANGHGDRGPLVSRTGANERAYRVNPTEGAGECGYEAGLGEAERMNMGNPETWVDAGDVEDYSIADTDGLVGKVKSTVGDARAKASEVGEQAAGSAKAATEAVTGRVKHAAEAVKHTGTVAYARTRDAAHQVTDAVREVPEQLGAVRHRASDFVRENPIVAGLLAAGLGAGLALLIPASRREKEILGEASDQVKTQVRGAVGEKLQRAKSAAQSVATAAVDTVRREVSPAQPEPGSENVDTTTYAVDPGDESMIRENPAVTERIRMATLSRASDISDTTIGR